MHVYRTQAGSLRDQAAAAPFAPTFIAGRCGPLFTVYHPPAAAARDRGDLIYLPPFAEELNRARRMAALQARALAAQGIGVLLLDPYGCGDSGGDFADARWETWLDDTLTAASWLGRQGRERLGLWGLRLGATLALDVAARNPGRFRHLVLWQPVTNGQTMLTQFLRVRVAAGLYGRAGGSVRELRELLTGGQPVEIAGYSLHPELARAIDDLGVASLGPRCQCPIDWFEVVGDGEADLPPPAQRLTAEWQTHGVKVAAHAAVGEPFWALQETTVAPALLAATTRHVGAVDP